MLPGQSGCAQEPQTWYHVDCTVTRKGQRVPTEAMASRKLSIQQFPFLFQMFAHPSIHVSIHVSSHPLTWGSLFSVSARPRTTLRCSGRGLLGGRHHRCSRGGVLTTKGKRKLTGIKECV